ncbi:hypothetical protein BGX27_005922 [Mortierella sp. AM989]|nr:hypothetical protein BGX27_005922 [Mortierella sp. AM989]
MLNRDLDDRPSASNIKMVEVQQEESHWSFRFPGRFIYPFISPFMRGPKPQENKRHVWEMSVWDPSILSRNLFCWYSPAQVLIMAGMNSENLHIFLPLSIIVGLQVHFLISVYQSYVKDKQILFGEVNREYNAKFVYPRIFVRKFDKQVSTEPDLADSSLQISDGEDSFRSVSDHKPRKFQHLSIPASSFSPLSPTRSTVFRGSPQMSLQESTSGTSSSESSEDDDDEDEEEEEDISDNEIDDEGVDPDLDYDEEGEEPAVPHPTNALRYSS